MKPVEIEFIMRDKLSEGMNKAGKSAESLGSKAEQVSKSITERIAEQKEQIQYVESCLKTLEKQYAKLAPGKAQLEMRAEINACTKALEEDKNILSALDQEHTQTAASSKRLSMQLREMQDAMARLRLEGKQNTQEYQDMAAKAANLSDTIGDLRAQTNVLANDNAGLQGVMSGVNGLSGAFTVATGLMGAFASENEDLIKIQTRVQSVMAITMGLQQVMNALNKDSAFRLVTVVRMKNMLMAANTRLAVALGISNVAATALMATLTLGLSAVITGLVVLWDKYSDAQQEAAEKAKERVKIESDGRAQMIKTRFEIENTTKSLKDFTGSKEQETAKVDELNRKYGESFGYYNSIAEWYDVLLQKGDDYIQMLFLQAKAQSLVNKAVEADEKVNEVKATKEGDVDGSMGWFSKMGLYMAQSESYGQIDAQSMIDKHNKEAKENAIKVAEGQRDAYLEEAKKLQEEYAKIGKEGGIGGFVTPKVDKPTGGAKVTNNLAELELKARQKIEDQRIALTLEGYERERAEALLNFEREKERITTEEQQRIALYEKLKAAGEKVDPEQKQVITQQASVQKVQAGQVYDANIAGIDKKEQTEQAESFKKILESYRTFAEQRLAIEEKYRVDIAELRKNGASEENVRVAEEQQSFDLEELDAVFAQKDVTFQVLLSRITSMSLEELYKALEQAKQALSKSESSNGKNSTQTATLRAKVTALQNEIKYAKAENDAKTPDETEKWNKNSASIKKCKAEIDNMLSSMDFLDESTKEALQSASNIAGGAIAMIDGIKMLGLGAAESISAVEKASVILAIVGAAVQIITAIFSMASAAEKRHQQALAEVAANKLAMQREYNLLLLEQNLLMKEASTIFGEQQIAKAANAVEVYRQAIQAYKDEMRGEAPRMNWFESMTGDAFGSYRKRLKDYEDGILGLSNVTIKTGHKKTGLFGWGKGKDIYSGVLDVYPDLLDGENRLNIERAKTIISTQTMSDENKALLQSLIDLQTQADEAQQALRDYLQDTFGGLGDGMMDSITEAIRNGNDAWESFGDKGSEVLENLGRQIAYSLFFADKFKKLQEQLEAVYGSGKSEEQIAQDAMNLVGDFYNKIGGDMDAAQAWMENWKEQAGQHGFDLWSKEDDTTTQSGKSGAFQTLTQDQGTKLEGLMTAQQIHSASIDEKMDNVSEGLGGALDALNEIKKNTDSLPKIYDELVEIKRDGLKMK